MPVKLVDRTPEAYGYPLLIKQLLHTPLATAPDQEITYMGGRRHSYRTLRERIEPHLPDSARDLQHVHGELRAAAQLILQDVIDDFVPQIEAELKRRLEARLPRLLPPRK